MLNGQLWIWSDQAVMGPTGGFKGAVNFAKLHVYECVHVSERSHSSETLQPKKKKDTMCSLIPMKRNAIFIESTIFIINFTNVTSLM